jgi:hypothetical protein
MKDAVGRLLKLQVKKLFGCTEAQAYPAVIKEHAKAVLHAVQSTAQGSITAGRGLLPEMANMMAVSAGAVCSVFHGASRRDVWISALPAYGPGVVSRARQQGFPGVPRGVLSGPGKKDS